MNFILFGNTFQNMANSKIQLEILQSTIPKIQALAPKLPLVTNYIQGMVFEVSHADYLNVHANYNVSCKNFICFWKRNLDLGFEKQETLNQIWENALINPYDYRNTSSPLMIFHNNCAMTVNSFADAIIEVLLLK